MIVNYCARHKSLVSCPCSRSLSSCRPPATDSDPSNGDANGLRKLATMAITEITRLAIIDELSLGDTSWCGRLEEPEFLSRLYKIDELPSTDGRFTNASGDIWQHRVNNFDWSDDWVFYDDRFNLMRGSDEEFLRFLSETLHPVLRRDADEVSQLVETYNRHLRHDGYELAAVAAISGRPVFAGRSVLTVPASIRDIERAANEVNGEYLTRQITRMEGAIECDPELAIGTAKEVVETCCKTILKGLGVEVDVTWKLQRLVKETAKHLRVTPGDAPDDSATSESIRTVLGSLGGVVAGLGELRNQYGTGHGRHTGSKPLRPRHARLAVGAASTLAVFLFDTYERRNSNT